MKAKKFFAFAMAALTLVGMSSCGKDKEVEVNSVTLDQTSLNLKVGETATLVATVDPAGAATVAWESQNPAIASVNNGVVTAVAEGSTLVIAKAGAKTASCIVKVGSTGGDTNKFAALLNHDDYYVIALDDNSFAKIASKVKDGHDFRMNGEYVGSEIPAETTSVLEIWGGSFEGGAGGGLNCFGEAEGYISLVSATGEGWGLGCGGLRQTHRKIDLTAVTADYKLAIAYKCPANNANTTVKFTLYGGVKGNEIAKEVSGNTNGEWVLLEYSMSEFFTAGLKWDSVIDCTDGSFAWYSLGLLINGVGNGLDVDAVLIYK